MQKQESSDLEVFKTSDGENHASCVPIGLIPGLGRLKQHFELLGWFSTYLRFFPNAKKVKKTMFQIIYLPIRVSVLHPVLSGRFPWHRLQAVHLPSVFPRPLGKVVQTSSLFLEPCFPRKTRRRRDFKSSIMHHFGNRVSQGSFGPKPSFLCPNCVSDSLESFSCFQDSKVSCTYYIPSF